jgi:hypothetical protein
LAISISDCAKVVRFGKVAIVYSPQHGAGWYSWHRIEELLFDPNLVDMIERGADAEAMQAYCEQHYQDERQSAYWGGIDDLAIAWIPEGSIFRISEYDGSESIVLQDDDDWIVA